MQSPGGLRRSPCSAARGRSVREYERSGGRPTLVETRPVTSEGSRCGRRERRKLDGLKSVIMVFESSRRPTLLTRKLAIQIRINTGV